MLESGFQKALVKELKLKYPSCIVLKNDTRLKQGFPDITILFQKKWAILECKKTKDEAHQPNQDYYVQKLDAMGFSRFIFPENRSEVLAELDLYFERSQ